MLSPRPELSELADHLLAIRRDRGRAPLDVEAWQGAHPQSRSEAYLVQQIVSKSFGPIGAWKVYRDPNEHDVIGAPIFKQDCYKSKLLVAGKRFRTIGVEAELGYRLAKDFRAQQHPYKRADMFEMIDAIVPLIEVVDSRLSDFLSTSELWRLSDNSVNGGVILGQPIENWSIIDAADQGVNLFRNDEPYSLARGWGVLGDPLTLITDFLNQVACHNGELKKGQIIATGSLTGLNFLNHGDRLQAQFVDLETDVTVQF